MVTEFFQSIASCSLDNRRLKYGLWVGLAYGAGDIVVTDAACLRAQMNVLKSGWRGLRAVKEVLKQINNDMDNRLDAMPVGALLAAGESRLGGTPSPFISNPAIVTEENWAAFRKLSTLGFMPEREIVAFCNLMGDCVVREAAAAAEYQQTRDPSARQRMAEAHLDLNNVCFGFVVHILRRDERVGEAVDTPLDLGALRHIYRNTSRLGELVQIQDDLIDFVDDFAEERRSKRPSANIVLAALGRTDAMPALLRQRGEKPDGKVSFRNLPTEVRTAVMDVRERYMEGIFALKPLLRRPLAGLWNASVLEGWSVGNTEQTADMETVPWRQYEPQSPPMRRAI